MHFLPDLGLTYIGFYIPAVSARLRAEGLTNFSDLKSLKKMFAISRSHSQNELPNDGKYLFGVWRIRLLFGLVHWVQDFARVGQKFKHL